MPKEKDLHASRSADILMTMLAIILLVLGMMTRLIPHWPNFTPVVAVALFSGLYLKGRARYAVPLGLMALSDAVIGLHGVVPFTWGSVLLIAWLPNILKSKRTWGSVTGGSLIGAVVFFLVTNFGTWLVYYPKTWEGLVSCFVLAIPFFRMTLLGTLVYSAALFVLYETMAGRLRNTRLSTSWLSH